MTGIAWTDPEPDLRRRLDETVRPVTLAFPPAAWFETPAEGSALFQHVAQGGSPVVMLSGPERARAAGWVYLNDSCYLDGSGKCMPPPPSPTGHSAFYGDPIAAVTETGEVIGVKVGPIPAAGGHTPGQGARSWGEARNVLDDPDHQALVGALIDLPEGCLFAGVAVPHLTYATAERINSSDISNEWYPRADMVDPETGEPLPAGLDSIGPTIVTRGAFQKRGTTVHRSGAGPLAAAIPAGFEPRPFFCLTESGDDPVVRLSDLAVRVTEAERIAGLYGAAEPVQPVQPVQPVEAAESAVCACETPVAAAVCACENPEPRESSEDSEDSEDGVAVGGLSPLAAAIDQAAREELAGISQRLTEFGVSIDFLREEAVRQSMRNQGEGEGLEADAEAEAEERERRQILELLRDLVDRVGRLEETARRGYPVPDSGPVDDVEPGSLTGQMTGRTAGGMPASDASELTPT